MSSNSKFSQLMRGYGSLTIFMIPIGIAINFVAAALFQALGGGWWNRSETLPTKD